MKHVVLELLDSFNSGGSERQAVQLARLLDESGRYTMRLAALDGGGVLRAEAERIGTGEIPDYPLTSLYDRNAARQVRRFAQFLKANNISVIHTHDFYTNIFGMTAAALAGVPVRIASRRESAVRSGGRRFVERCAYRLAQKVVANCDEVRTQLVAEGVPARKVVTLYNGLDMRRVEPPAGMRRDEVLASLNLPASGRLFVTIVANMRLDLKDHPTFLRAARRVSAAVPEAAFVLAGEGELKDSLQSFAGELGLASNVFFTGRCTNVAELLAVSDVCVLSSIAEGFSNSILEYMAASRAVVATDVGGAREAVVEGETGYLVPAGDDALMAERLITLLRDDDLRCTMGKRGRRRVEEQFSCAAQLLRTEELYDELLAHAGQGEVATAVPGMKSEEA